MRRIAGKRGVNKKANRQVVATEKLKLAAPDGGEAAAETSIGTFHRHRVSTIAFLRGSLLSLYEFVAGAIEGAVRGFHDE